jgi:hypothetical protein
VEDDAVDAVDVVLEPPRDFDDCDLTGSYAA